MNIPLGQAARLIQGRSDDKDTTLLANAMRDLWNQNVNVWPDPITTTNATPTAVWFDAMPVNSIGDFWMVVIAQIKGTSTAASFRRRVAVSRGSGAVAYIGAGTDIIGADKVTVGGWDVGFGLDSDNPANIYATVTGAVSTSILWRANIIGTVLPWA